MMAAMGFDGIEVSCGIGEGVLPHLGGMFP